MIVLNKNADNNFEIRTSFESKGLLTDQENLGATETKTDRLFQKQLSYLKKHGAEIHAFLKNVAKGTEELEESRETAQKAQAIARKALPLLEHLNTSNPEEVNAVLDLCLEVHIKCVEDETKTAKAKFVSPSFMKRVERLDRLIRSGSSKIFPAISIMATSLLVPIQKPTMQATNSGTANPSYFITQETDNSKQMVFKPSSKEKQVFSVIGKGEGFRRQVAAYLLDKSNGGSADIPLSVAADEEDQGFGSIQTFRKNQGDLSKISDQASKKIPLAHFQHVTLHRLRLYDLDGHLGNYLHKESHGQIKLIPIDFDYSLPRLQYREDASRADLKMGTRFFPHMDRPLEPEVKEHLLSIDIEKDAEILSNLGFGDAEINLYKHTTTMLQEMAKRDFTLGEMLDELDSKDFKLQVIETPIEDLHKVCGDRIGFLLETKEQLAAKLKEPIKTADDGAYTVRILFEDFKSPRAVLVIVRDLLQRFPNEKETAQAIEYLKGFYNLKPNAMHDLFRSIVNTMETEGLHDQALALQKWLETCG